MTWDADFGLKLKREAAARLLACAKTLQNEDRKRRGVKYPPAASKGEYPHLRTGAGRAGIMHDPQTIDGVIGNGMSVRVGYAKNTFYSALLERKGWKGLLDTLADLRGQLVAILKGSGSITTG